MFFILVVGKKICLEIFKFLIEVVVLFGWGVVVKVVGGITGQIPAHSLQLPGRYPAQAHRARTPGVQPYTEGPACPRGGGWLVSTSPPLGIPTGIHTRQGVLR